MSKALLADSSSSSLCSNTYFHDHYKASLVSHSDSNGAEDKGKLHITYANNHWKNINSRQPLLRFGTAHIINSYFEGGTVGDTAINTRMGTFKKQKAHSHPENNHTNPKTGAQTLVESNVFVGIKDPLSSQFSKEKGYAVEKDNDFGSGENSAPAGTLKTVPYKYTLLGSKNVKAAVVGKAGQTLTLG
jgi:pectate lyase